MRRIGVLLVVLAMAVGSGVAAARVTYPTSIQFSSTGFGLNNAEAFGKVTSTRAACVPNRLVKFFGQTATGEELIDTDRTSANGFFGGGGELSGEPTGIRVRVIAKRLGPDRFCGATGASRDAP